MTDIQSLIADLADGERTNLAHRRCQACVALESVDDPRARIALEAALGGTIGRDRLSAILKRNGLEVGPRAIIHHRKEGHLA